MSITKQADQLAILDAVATALGARIKAIRTTLAAEIAADTAEGITTDHARITFTPARVEVTDDAAFAEYALGATGATVDTRRVIAADADMDAVLAVLEQHLPDAVETTSTLTDLSTTIALASLAVSDGVVITAADGTVVDFAAVKPASIALASSPQKKHAAASAETWVEQFAPRLVQTVAQHAAAELVTA